VERYAGFDLVLIAASQGGLPVCRKIVAELPPDFPAALIYAQHRSPGASTAAADLLQRSTDLQVRVGIDGMEVKPGTITVPPADVYVRVAAERRLELTPGHPGTELADSLFVSAARAYGPRALAVVLTGRLQDGTAGVRAIKARGGRVIVQDPATSEQDSMPRSALATGCVDLVLDPPRIAAALVTLVMVPGGPELFGVRSPAWIGSPSPN
jgi:two-component system, chemotaxis family, protein-glutamate methylesterase/glutaminase